MEIALAALGAVCLAAWIAGVGWVFARRPAPAVRAELGRALPALAATLRALAADEALTPQLRSRARLASRYVGSPFDLLPYPIAIDDVVVALEALKSIHEAHGLAPIERAFRGDELGWNAVREGLGLAPEWE
ncbi:MAG: hypothetical protein KF729_03420 [Sandaracinaceae bacterium]|nr:hypothetical protein [Sandaracinaceae bacterium]